MNKTGLCAIALSALVPLLAQTQTTYSGVSITGSLVLIRSINARQTAQSSLLPQSSLFAATLNTAESPKAIKRLTPRLSSPSLFAATLAPAPIAVQTVNVVPGPVSTGFNGLSHLDQRLANGGNQFSVEPPNASIAVGNGYVLEGVNNAIQVYSSSGATLLAKVISTNELFGVSPAINRATGVNGVFPTDMRVFYDAIINRWIVLQRAQDFDIAGNGLSSSRIFLAMSQTGDPTGTYNIYTMETTNANNPGCPCVADYPQIGADQYGFYISVNEFTTTTQAYVDSVIYAISKRGLAAGELTPTSSKFTLPFVSGYEFSIQPATTPPGASNFVASGGLEFFASTVASFASGTNVAVWAMSNTSSLSTTRADMMLARIIVPTLFYSIPDAATQPEGYRPYGAGLTPQGALPLIDGGDTRAQSLFYSAGRLHLTFATKVSQTKGNRVGAAYVILSPTARGGVISAQVIKQSIFAVSNNNLLRPSIGVDANGRGAIAATVVGPDWYPSAAFIPIDPVTASTMVRIPAAGAFPEDGFTGYSPGSGGQTIARWGDYSSTAVANDGSVWMVAQYIGTSPRTAFANWGTFIMSTKL